MALVDQERENQAHSGFQPNHSRRCPVKFDILLLDRMWGVVRGNCINSTVFKAFNDRIKRVNRFRKLLLFDQFFSIEGIVEDVAKRPYITVGFAAFLVLTALAVTSNNKMIKRLGGARWKALHSLVYVAAAAGVVHYLWLVKLDTRNPTIYGVILMVLLASRLVRRRSRRPS